MSLLVSSLRSVLDSQTCASLIQNLQQQIVSLPFESSELPELIEGFAGLVAYVNPDDWEVSFSVILQCLSSFEINENKNMFIKARLISMISIYFQYSTHENHFQLGSQPPLNKMSLKLL